MERMVVIIFQFWLLLICGGIGIFVSKKIFDSFDSNSRMMVGPALKPDRDAHVCLFTSAAPVDYWNHKTYTTTMEAALDRIIAGKKQPGGGHPPDAASSKNLKAAIEELRTALQDALPFLIHQEESNNYNSKPARPTLPSSSDVSVSWLLSLCNSIPSEGGLEPIQIARAIVEAANATTNEAQQQDMLFDVLGASNEAMNVLMEVAPKLPLIRNEISIADIDAIRSASSSLNAPITVAVDLEEERRHMLLREAINTAHLAAVAKAELEELEGGGMGGNAVTHTIVRNSDVKARKFAEKAAKRAELALKRAKDAGAILDEQDLLKIDKTSLGDGGLVNRTEDAVRALQLSLLPEGSRQYYDQRALPKDAIREIIGDIERVIIPAPLLDKENLPPRLTIRDIMDSECAKAFAGKGKHVISMPKRISSSEKPRDGVIKPNAIANV
jgi:hypothetical protein